MLGKVTEGPVMAAVITKADNSDQSDQQANGLQQSAVEYRWRVHSNAKLRGAGFEPLTLTSSWVEFNTVSFTAPSPLSDADGHTDCWASTFWGYNLDQCLTGESLNSPTSAWTSALGVYSNDNFESFGHYTYASSKGIGYQTGDNRFETECYGHTIPFFPAHLVCEQDHEFIGIQ